VLENGPEPDLMLRTDMDALPVQKQTDLPYASTSTAIQNDGTQYPFCSVRA
jgi:hippurate hydrolase